MHPIYAMRTFFRRSLQDIIVDLFCYLMCILVLITTFYPFYYVLIISFNDGADAVRGGIYFWPRVFTLDNYKSFLSDDKWIQAMGITTARTVIGTILSVIFTCLVAYSLSFKRLIGRKVYMGLVVFCMYFSGGIIPYYVTLRFLHLINTFWVYIIPGMLNLFFVIIAISFFQEIPSDLRESAMLDGASDLRIFAKIILPVSMPLVATMALFHGVAHWNSWYDAAFFVQNKQLRTLGYVLMEVINKSQVKSSDAAAAAGAMKVTTLSIQMAAMVIAIGPIVAVYPFLQKYFVKGMMVGAVKG
jgi:putative aldouronate transport system permease protein